MHAPHPLPTEDYKTYLFRYYFDGSHWELPIKAKTPEEAQARLSRLSYATYDGELFMSIPAYPGAGILARIITFFKRFSSYAT